MNDTIDTLLTRKSVRSYKPELIRDEELLQIVNAGMAAPSGMNAQPVKFVVVRDKETRDQLSEMNRKIMGVDFDPFYGAPELIVVLARKDRPTYLYDGALAMGNLLNAACSLGVGSCWIHRAKEEFESEEGKALLKKWGLDPDEYEGIGHCILGYSEDKVTGDKVIQPDRVLYV